MRAVQLQRFGEDQRVGVEAPLPKRVAQDDYGARAGRLMLFSDKRAAQDRTGSQIGEIVVRHELAGDGWRTRRRYDTNRRTRGDQTGEGLILAPEIKIFGIREKILSIAARSAFEPS